MIIGVDFDNTIVCYDALFHRAAVERALVPKSVPATKNAVRDYLRRAGREDAWTALQGEVYGARLAEADPFPGALDFFRFCRSARISVRIVSHKTRRPFLGAEHDLHAAARAWLTQHGFFATDDIGLAEGDAFFELTKPEKIARIASSGCTAFIDDLPEILGDPAFPAGVARLLFDPTNAHELPPDTRRCRSWTELREHLFARVAARRFALTLSGDPVALSGGANNRVQRLDLTSGKRVLLKEYFSHPTDARDRFASERAFYRYAHEIAGARCLPRSLGWDESLRCGLFEYIDGRKLSAGEVNESAIDAATAFFATLNATRHTSDAQMLPRAAEACFTTNEHLAAVQRRMDRLASFRGESAIDSEAHEFVQRELLPAWACINADAQQASARDTGESAWSQRCISPSDFGFHNALQRADGSLVFFDFEYAGWDDPAKFVCDFFCQPAAPVPIEFFDRVAGRIAAAVEIERTADFVARCHALLPVYRIKWCGILLNEFIASQSARRSFALGNAVADERKAAQLNKARIALEPLRFDISV